MSQRGCGALDSRQFLEELDNLGVDRGSSITTNHTSFSCAMPSNVLPRVLELYADLVRTPHLPEDQLSDARLLGMQDLRALEDEPAHRCFSELKRFRFPLPYGRISQGTREGLAAIDLDKLQHFFQSNYHPSGSILAVAGNFDWNELSATVDRAFGEWQGATEPKLPPLKPRLAAVTPITHRIKRTWHSHTIARRTKARSTTWRELSLEFSATG